MISEPMTLATDYALGGVTAYFAVYTLQNAEEQRSRQSWGAAFIALACAAIVGGSHHGFAVEALWKPTVWIVGIAAAAMLAGSVFATTEGAVRQALLAVALAKLAAFWFWTWRDDRFIWVVADTGAAFVLVALLHFWRWREPGSRWIVGGVGVSIAAAAVQAGGFDLHRHFNHNDLYHLIQIVAMAAFYRGARQIRDADHGMRSGHPSP